MSQNVLPGVRVAEQIQQFEKYNDVLEEGKAEAASKVVQRGASVEKKKVR